MRFGFHRDWLHAASGVLALIAISPTCAAQNSRSGAAASFDAVMQPIIFKNCNGCHTYGGHAGGLRLDSYETLLKGGDRGAVIVPGDPESSALMKAVRYQPDFDLKMPPRGKLADADIKTIEKWIAQKQGPQGALSTASAPAASAAVVHAAPPQLAAAPAPPAAAPTAHAAPVPAPTDALSAASVPASPAGIQVVAKPAEPASSPISPEQGKFLESFFESKVRPILVKNCYTCHTNLSSGGLRLDSREAILKGGKDGAVVVAGHPESSLLVSAIHYDSKLKMPPGGPLKPDEVAVLEQWIRDGVAWPKSTPIAASARVAEEQRNFWSFRAPSHPAVPPTKSHWAYNDIDRFILSKLEEKGLKPVGDADKRTLIRRLTYDLTGLPPTPAEIEAFFGDKSPNAYEKLVERLLASKAYGERWGRMWLDVVRYADTTGGGGDYPIPQAYKYRDYVIQAFNDDKPYDRFIREQLAGDLLPAQSEAERWQNIVATGYLAGTVRGEGKPDSLSDAVDNLGAAFLGITLGCARCHDHKFDPIPTGDYYALYGILASTHFPEPGNDAVRFQRGFVYRNPKATEREDYKTFQRQLKPIQDAIEAVLKLPGTYDDLLPQLEARRMHLFEHVPDLGESAYAVTEGEPEDAKIQRYGDPKDLGDQVRRGFLQALGGGPLAADGKGSGRMELADWIASPDNPLTARVIVNRIWQGHFGRGIVATANDFGKRGVPPSNQALLDYLAWKLVDSRWSIKAIHREILLSHAYHLSSADAASNEEIDPDNAYIWRHSGRRLDAEGLRDSLLAESQLLDQSPSGPYPFPPQSEWNWEDQNHFAPDFSKYETDRRTVYTMIQRTVRLTYFTLFDGPNTNASTEQRGASLTPLQALYFMNGAFPKRCAAKLASQLLAGESVEKDRIKQAFLIIYGRPPSQAETDRAVGFLHSAAESYAAHGVTGAAPQQLALEELVKAMFASNEFMFIE